MRSAASQSGSRRGLDFIALCKNLTNTLKTYLE